MKWELERQRRQQGDIGRANATGPRKPRVAIGRSGEDFANTTAQREAAEESSLLEVVTGMTPEVYEEKSQLECIDSFVKRGLPVPERFHGLALKHGINIEGP